MARNLITTQVQQSLNEAVLLFYDNRISFFPTVDQQHRPIDIITWRDILKVLALQYRKSSWVN